MSNASKDDFFEETKMSFGEHLEELRVVLFRALIGLVVGFLVGLMVANDVVQFFQIPIKDALDKYYLEKAKTDIGEQYESIPPEVAARIEEDELVPKDELVDPQAILECLKFAAPDEFGDIQFKPNVFVEGDLPVKNTAKLAKELVEQSGDSGQPGHALWKQLSPEQQKSVQQIAKKSSATKSDREELLGVLNVLADNPKVHESKAFKDVLNSFSSARRKTLDRIRDDVAKANNADESRRLNKLLIAGAFPKFLNTPRVPLVKVPVWRPTEVSLQSLNAQESFMIWLKAGFIAGLIIASPYIFWQIWLFVAAGLYPHERKYVYIYLPFSIVLFLGGAAMAFFLVFEPVLDFLFSFNRRMDIDPDPRIGEWLSFVLFLPLGFGIAFQLPLVMLFIHRIGFISLEQYLKKWRIAILVIFVASMLLTPADPISMMMLAGPLTALYFLGIVLCKWMPRGRNPFSEAYEPS